MTANATVSGRVTSPGTTTGIKARVRATPATQGNAVPFSGDTITWGPVVVDTAADGRFTMLVPIKAGVLWEFTASPLAKAPVSKVLDLGAYAVTGDLDLTSAVPVVPTEVTPSFAAGVSAAAAAAAASASAAATSAAQAAAAATPRDTGPVDLGLIMGASLDPPGSIPPQMIVGRRLGNSVTLAFDPGLNGGFDWQTIDGSPHLPEGFAPDTILPGSAPGFTSAPVTDDSGTPMGIITIENGALATGGLTSTAFFTGRITFDVFGDFPVPPYHLPF